MAELDGLRKLVVIDILQVRLPEARICIARNSTNRKPATPNVVCFFVLGFM